MILINPLSENLTVQKFNARKIYKAYIDLHFIVIICKNFHFASAEYNYVLRTFLMIKFN